MWLWLPFPAGRLMLVCGENLAVPASAFAPSLPPQHLGSEGVQCNGCLALMALVRGEGEASDGNRLRLAECGGVTVIADGALRLVGGPALY